MKWKEIQTPSFQVIFPADIEEDGKRMADVLTSIIARVSKSYNIVPKKISVILQNQGTSSNGFVQLAPRRSEFFTTPSQEFDFQDWLNSLAVHELRHVAQFDKLTGKISAPLEDLALAIFGITLPPWFFEGDAVAVETSLTDAGRGRQPEFDLVIRTNTLSGRRYSYSKDYLGSVKNNTAGYYPLGFFMVTKLRRDHGAGILDSLLSRIARNPLRPYSFSSAMKKYAGFNTRQLHDSMIAEMQTVWQRAREEAGKPTQYAALEKRDRHNPVNYFMPVALPTGNIAALKQGLGTPPGLVEIDSLKNEKLITKIGIQEDPYFRYTAGKFVWDERRFDKRFQKRSYNVIMLLDAATGSVRQVTHTSRLFSPALSPDGVSIVAIEVAYPNRISLVRMDLSGKEQKRIPSPSNQMLQHPSFHPGGEKLVVTAVSNQGKTLYEVNLNTGSFTRLIPYQLQLISKPVYAGNDLVVYKAHYKGVDNLVGFNTLLNTYQDLTSAEFGAYNPSYDEKNNRLLFNNYSADGHTAAAINLRLNPGTFSPSGPVNGKVIEYISPVSVQENSSNVFDSIPRQSWPLKPYHDLKNLFNFHSLVPILEENEIYDDLNIGLKLQSDNKLNTLSLYMGYQFNNALKKPEYLAGLTYSKFYPVFSLTWLNRARFFSQQQLVGTQLIPVPIRWRENVVEGNISFPFLFNRLNHVYSIVAETGTSYIHRYDFSSTPKNFTYTFKFPLLYRLAFVHNTIRSQRDLAPAWGQYFELKYRDSPFEKAIDGSVFTFESAYYFPGILRHHSLQVSVNAQNASGNYKDVTDIPTISGYTSLNRQERVRNTILTDYRFPIFYPDWEIGPLAYIKRFTGGLFADFQNISGSGPKPATFGFEIKAEMNLLRFYLPNFAIGSKVIFTRQAAAQNPVVEAGLTYSY